MSTMTSVSPALEWRINRARVIALVAGGVAIALAAVTATSD